MKKLILLLLVCFIACNVKQSYKFNVNDHVYILPDSIPAIITHRYPQRYADNYYDVFYQDKLGRVWEMPLSENLIIKK